MATLKPKPQGASARGIPAPKAKPQGTATPRAKPKPITQTIQYRSGSAVSRGGGPGLTPKKAPATPRRGMRPV
jgi:hypothetical protein